MAVLDTQLLTVLPLEAKLHVAKQHLSRYLFLCIFIIYLLMTVKILQESHPYRVTTEVLISYFCAAEAVTVIWTTNVLGTIRMKSSKWCLLISDSSSICSLYFHVRGEHKNLSSSKLTKIVNILISFNHIVILTVQNSHRFLWTNSGLQSTC